MPDPLTLPMHDTAIVATGVITFAGIVRWFQGQRHLTGDRGGMNWRLPLLPGMVILHLVPPPALSPS